MTVTIRVRSSDWDTGERLRRIVSSANADVPVADVRPLVAWVSDAISTPASTTMLIGTFAGLAVLLGAVGIYGVLSFLVSTRTREIGIRVALGAQPREVRRLVLKEGAKVAIAGISLGSMAAVVVNRWLTSELYGVSALDPATYLCVAAVMTVVTFLACGIPTRRALRIDPLVALRDG